MPDASDRRQKALRVIKSFGYVPDSDFTRFINRAGGFRKAASDEVLASFAMFLVDESKVDQRLNRENRARITSQVTGGGT